MKKALFNFTIFTACLSSVSVASQKAPLSSTEEISFLSAQENSFIGLNKTKNFKGLLTRTGHSQEEGSQFDIYEFETNKYTMDEKLCTKVLELVYGPRGQITLKLIQKNLLTVTKSNNACEAVYVDPDPQAFFKEHRFYVIILQNKIIGLAANFKKPATKNQIDDIQNFISKLKPAKRI